MESLPETLNWLYSLEARGEIYKLERMEQALALIGNPHLELRAVHIAGTKGKGSVAAMLDACLRAAGYRSGLYTKPHLVNLTERTRIDGAEMPGRLMLEYITRLRDIYERAGLALTFFECGRRYRGGRNRTRRPSGFDQRAPAAAQRYHANRLRPHGAPWLHHHGDSG